MWVCAEFNLWNNLVIFILFQKRRQRCVAGWFRAFNSDLHCVGGEQGEGEQNCRRGTSHCQSCMKKHPPSHRLGCLRQQCVYNADCTEMGSRGLWGSSNCIITNSTKVKPELHKAPFILSSTQPRILALHFLQNTDHLWVFYLKPYLYSDSCGRSASTTCFTHAIF